MSKLQEFYEESVVRMWEVCKGAAGLRFEERRNFETGETDVVLIKTGQTQRKLNTAVSYRVLIERCDKSGWLIPWLNGMEWERIPICEKKKCCGECRRALRGDIIRLRKNLNREVED